jgi:hypothetical protein
VLQPDAWEAGQRLPAERPARQGASESGLQAAAPIRAARLRAMVSAVARQQVLARPEPVPERQAQQPDEPASAQEQRVSQQQEPPEREPA